ncbi:MAG: PCRF domain-containing protein [Clostridia bacterium]|nr:PCRF domain-containing protein [Clostridia bacterium]
MREFFNIYNELKELKAKFNRIEELLSFEEVLLDKKLFLHLSRQQRDLEPLVSLLDNLESLEKELCDLKELSRETGCDVLADEEQVLNEKIIQTKEEIVSCYRLYKSSEECICLVVVNMGKSKRLQELLFERYQDVCKKQSFDCNIVESGDKCLLVSGIGVNDFFKKECGIHSSIDTQEKCCVITFDNVFESLDIKDDDFEVFISRSSGAGGQHINTTDSAVRVTHKPTGISAVCSDERSQVQNRKIAFERVRQKVIEKIKEQNSKEYKKTKDKCLLKYQSGNVVRLYDLKNNAMIDGEKSVPLDKVFK